MRNILLITVACSSCGDARGSTCVRVDGILGHQQLRRSTDQPNHYIRLMVLLTECKAVLAAENMALSTAATHALGVLYLRAVLALSG